MAKDEFRKPQWFEEAETDDELFDDDRKFAFQIFTNPMELQKHFERQMQQILEAVSEMEGGGTIYIAHKKSVSRKLTFFFAILFRQEHHC